jgi:hypothetical protein
MTKANPYEYAGDNPVNNVDGSGKDFVNCAAAYAIAILGVVGAVAAVALAIASLPATGPLFLGLSPVEVGLAGGVIGYAITEGGAFLAFYNGACG